MNSPTFPIGHTFNIGPNKPSVEVTEHAIFNMGRRIDYKLEWKTRDKKFSFWTIESRIDEVLNVAARQ